jgi:hypothetical protein
VKTNLQMKKSKDMLRNIMNTKEAISNLELMSKALEVASNSPQNYNSDWGFYLEQMSWQMHKQAKELKELSYLFDGTLQLRQ